MMKRVNQFPDSFVQFAKPKVVLKVKGIFNLKLITESLQLNKNNPELTA